MWARVVPFAEYSQVNKLAIPTSFQAKNKPIGGLPLCLREGDRLLYIILFEKVANEKTINGIISSLTGGGELPTRSVLNRDIQW